MELIVIQDIEDIFVLKEDNLYMKVKREYDLWGGLICNYYKGKELIISSYFFVIILFTFLKINYRSNIYKSLKLIKKGGKYYLNKEKLFIYTNRKIGFFNDCDIYVNDNKVGELRIKREFSSKSGSLEYKFILFSDFNLLDEILIRLFLDFQTSLPSD